MNIRWQGLMLVIFVLFSLLLTRNYFVFRPITTEIEEQNKIIMTPSVVSNNNLSYQAAALVKITEDLRFNKKKPIRDWNVLDPPVQAAAVLMESVEDNFPFFYYQTYRSWPTASLIKILTAVVVIEQIGLNKKIPITNEVVATEGDSGGLTAGEIYTAQDLLKIMVITSSNDAAAAFENYYGKEALIQALRAKANDLKMSQTKIFDASGLADENMSTAADLVKLIRYVLIKHPQILEWSRLPTLLVQPINDVNSRYLKNINPLVEDSRFLGGKTGTSAKAGQNLITILLLDNRPVIMILLGSRNRLQDIADLTAWLKKAYQF